MKKFGKLEDGILKLAPKCGIIDNIMYSKFTDRQYFDLGYKEVIDAVPVAQDGFDTVFDGYDQTDTTISLRYAFIEKPVKPNEISKIKFRIALMKLGIWDAVVEWMKSTEITIDEGITMSCYDAWNDALVIDTNSPMFAPYLDKAKNAFAEQLAGVDVDTIIQNCKAE